MAGPQVTWDWEGNDGYVVTVNGRMVRCAISAFTKAKWDKINAVYKYKTSWCAASRDGVGQACHDTLVEALKAME